LKQQVRLNFAAIVAAKHPER